MTFKERTKFRTTKKWKTFRQELIEKRGSYCACCGIKKKGLQVHHRDSEHYEELDSEKFDLLCANCHSLIEKFMRRFRGKKANTIKNPELWFALLSPFFSIEKPK